MRKRRLGIILLIPFANASVSDGPYVGVEAGVANQIINFGSGSFNINTNGANLTSNAVAFLLRGNIGYSIDKYSSVEFGTTYNFNSSFTNPGGISNFGINATTIDLSYILSLPTTVENLSIFGRFGVAYNWINSPNNGCCCVGNSASLSGNGFADVLGAGIKYKLSPNLTWRVEWIANGLIFPTSLNSQEANATWTNQTFQTGINYSF